MDLEFGIGRRNNLVIFWNRIAKITEKANKAEKIQFQTFSEEKKPLILK